MLCVQNSRPDVVLSRLVNRSRPNASISFKRVVPESTRALTTSYTWPKGS